MSDDAISPYVHGMINSIGARWAFEVDLVVDNQIVHGYLSWQQLSRQIAKPVWFSWKEYKLNIVCEGIYKWIIIRVFD